MAISLRQSEYMALDDDHSNPPLHAIDDRRNLEVLFP